MKRKLTFGTIILTTFLLCGCTTGDVKNTDPMLENSQTQGTDQAQSTDQTQNATQTQVTDQLQNTAQTQSTDQTQSTEQTQGADQMQNTEPAQTTGLAQSTTQSQDNTVQSGDAQGTMISEDDAKEIALSHAGISTEDVTFIKSELDFDDGRQYYDVEFYTQDQKDYDYEIDPYTGEIIEWDVESIHDINS